MSRERLGEILNVPAHTIARFERGRESLATETLDLIIGAGLIMITLAVHTEKLNACCMHA